MADLRQAFILKALNRYNEQLLQRMKIVAQRAGINKTGEGLQSLAYQVAASGQGAVSKFSFKEYLRMVDMGAGRGHPIGGLKSTIVTLQAQNKSGIAQVKDNTRKKKSFLYSKPAYGLLTGFQNDVLYGFTEEAKEILKQELTAANQIN